MKAAVLDGPGELSIDDVVIDSPGPREILVRVAATGLCHSDLHFLTGLYSLPAPTVLGHEGAGVVEAVGSEVTIVEEGDHVISFPHGFCGTCDYCLTGHPTLCAQVGLARPPGTAPRLRFPDDSRCDQLVGLGTFAEQMIVHENMLVKINPDIPLDSAAMLGCGVPTGLGAVIRTARVSAGANVAVIGCGGIGLNCIQGALIAGANHIIAIDINDDKLELAKQFGATDIINNTDGDALEQVAELLPGPEFGVDYSFEALGLKETYELAFALLRRGGTATVIGIGAGSFELPIIPLLQERKVQGCAMGSVQFREDLPYLLDLYQAGRLKLDELISNRIKLEEINSGFTAMRDGAVARSVVVFE